VSKASLENLMPREISPEANTAKQYFTGDALLKFVITPPSSLPQHQTEPKFT